MTWCMNVLLRILCAVGALIGAADAKAGGPAPDNDLQQAEGKPSKLSATMTTPTLWAVSPDGLACNLSNISDETRQGRLQIIAHGVILKDSGIVSIKSLDTYDFFEEGPADGAPMFCYFMMEGSKDDYRAAAKLFTLPNSSDFAALAAY